MTRSLVLRSSSSSSSSSIEDEGGEESLLEKIGSYLRKSGLGIISKRQKLPNFEMEHGHDIRWRKGELIGCGAYGRVYMGMDLDTGELLAVKQVSIATKHATKDKAQENILELEEEIKLLKNLTHPNIVKYLGTARNAESLNILLEFVPGGSISSLLGKFGSFPEPVIRTYTEQLLKGLEYLHGNGIIHRDIKGANILVDNKGCIKLSDFGASKKVVELATASGTELIKGTPYWMAPEVILQTGQSFSADIWSVGCTVIEMATGKPPWSEQYEEVAALFHIGTTKSHPPIPEHLSLEAKEFLLKCLHKEPDLRPAASDLLQHPFVSEKNHAQTLFSDSGSDLKNFPNSEGEPRATCKGLMGDYNISNLKQSTTYSEQLIKYGPTSEASNSDDKCHIGNDDDFKVNQMLGPEKDLMLDPSKLEFPGTEGLNFKDCGGSANGSAGTFGMHAERSDGIPFPGEPTVSENDDDPGGGVDEVTESKIQGFLDDKAQDLKKLQTLFYEEFHNMLNSAADTSTVEVEHGEDPINDSKMPVRRSAPSRFASGVSTPHRHCKTIRPTSSRMHIPHSSSSSANNILRETPESLLNQRFSCSEREKKWKEELDQELERHREMMRHAGVSRKTSLCKDRGLKRSRDLS
ncbi:mitogen-activated protein kinase kinase kinase NPK1-like [Macadamia integrifolia]|uniref:mitogen-activated protein kinase kinase kinase NPK1-like n=1 Tax=Macadamia integrifolia TaxID=60698 RepID=UPI001C4F3DDE|nr:mitogen-activated protein kinase kinase kinase NPK1-like [Macadamia integrifolia]